MSTDFNEMCMSATPGHDKTPTWFWGILPYFHSYCGNFAWWIFLLDLRRSSSEGDSTVKIIFYGCDNSRDHFQMKNLGILTFAQNIDCGCASISRL